MPQKTATPRVHALPDALIDQIAAGEVVERPASVVKELVENALDAGAQRVRIEVRAGGADFIGVTDDGCGMTPEDAGRAMQRHATSKTRQRRRSAQRIATYGFRGEALPAIASVSTLLLRTRPHDAAEGYEIRIEQGKLVHEPHGGRPRGHEDRGRRSLRQRSGAAKVSEEAVDRVGPRFGLVGARGAGAAGGPLRNPTRRPSLAGLAGD